MPTLMNVFVAICQSDLLEIVGGKGDEHRPDCHLR
jgi:hypothetical protein